MTAIYDRGIAEQALPGSWKMPLLLTTLVLGWILLAYWRTVAAMVGTWERSETFAHGFVVVPIVLWLVWRQRQALVWDMPSPSRPAAWALLPVGLVWLAGSLAAANAVMQLALVALLVLAVPALLGWEVTRKLAFPLGFLVFAVPVGEFLIPQLMDWTARFTVLGLRFSGVPVYQDGLDFVIPTGTWSVVEACSGIRYLIASLMVGTLYAYLNYRSPRRRLAFMAVSAVVPVVANWMRAYLIVMIGHLSGNRLATGVDHLIYGWLFFGVVVAVIFVIGARWAEAGDGDPGPAAMARPGRVAAHTPGWRTAGLVALVATLPVLAMAGIERANVAPAPVMDKGLEEFAASGWRPVPEGAAELRPAFREAPESWHRTFEKDGQRVGLYIGYYRNQGPDHKLAGTSGGLLRADDRHWTWTDRGLRQAGTGGERLAANRAELRPRAGQVSTQPLVAWQWYWAGGAMTASAHRARARIAWSRLLGRGDDSAVIVVYGPATPEGEAALAAFSQSAGAAITHLLNATRNRR